MTTLATFATPNVPIGFFYLINSYTCSVITHLQFPLLTLGISGVTFSGDLKEIAFFGSSATNDYLYVISNVAPNLLPNIVKYEFIFPT